MVEADFLLSKTNLIEVGVAQLVARFEFAVVLGLLLDGVVCQMHKLIVAVGEAEFFAACADVAFFVVPSPQNSLLFFKIRKVAEQSEDSDVEFAAVDEEGVLDVAL